MDRICSKCGDSFAEKGLELVVHDVVICQVCPACISGANEVQLLLRRDSPGKPYTPALIEIVKEQACPKSS